MWVPCQRRVTLCFGIHPRDSIEYPVPVPKPAEVGYLWLYLDCKTSWASAFLGPTALLSPCVGAKCQCPCPLQPQDPVSGAGKGALGPCGTLHWVCHLHGCLAQQVSAVRSTSSSVKPEWSGLMDSELGKQDPGICACTEQNMWAFFFFFNWKSSLKQGCWLDILSGKRRQQQTACQGRASCTSHMGCSSHAYTWEKAGPKPPRDSWCRKVDCLNASRMGTKTCLLPAGWCPCSAVSWDKGKLAPKCKWEPCLGAAPWFCSDCLFTPPGLDQHPVVWRHWLPLAAIIQGVPGDSLPLQWGRPAQTATAGLVIWEILPCPSMLQGLAAQLVS